MKKLSLFLLLTAISMPLAFADVAKDTTGIDSNNLAGVVVKTTTTKIPVSKDGKKGKVKNEANVSYHHNNDSGLDTDKGKELAQDALNEHNKNKADDKEVSLGIFSTIGGVISGGIGAVLGIFGLGGSSTPAPAPTAPA
ncbi:MAG: hypothetical protein Q8L85_01580 [Alphaproteobacteria bacterium]|nr:hypothetical protein [Alphaproteobacteria bacterium]